MIKKFVVNMRTFVGWSPALGRAFVEVGRSWFGAGSRAGAPRSGNIGNAIGTKVGRVKYARPKPRVVSVSRSNSLSTNS